MDGANESGDVLKCLEAEESCFLFVTLGDFCLCYMGLRAQRVQSHLVPENETMARADVFSVTHVPDQRSLG